ncbi:hypothetical protein MCOR25_007146 [Pyricularia grisea]|uniref:Infection structure specific protein n=1 Tax=Pyricularia grisea TaxID=148305 RepID=A0A6P8BEB6_PYRGI|nr:uncharacterized protein PgNI_03816 [Pyricularia grisea]KAI6359176.1 hypothetical protein MCOR25_007146 [Pyricularia grisea]TLD14094.1 hypothetical protein PgNI_03816 [Pyricularia grisea]
MHSNTVLFMIAAATGVMSAELNLFPGHAVVRREVAARETTTASLPTSNDPCLASLVSISKGLPTPGADLLSALASNTETNPCSITVPASVSDKFNSYTSTIRSWYSSNSAAINSVLSQCPKLSSLAGQLPVCTGKDSSSKAASTTTMASSGAATTRANDGGSASATAATAGAGDSSGNPTSSIATSTKSGSGPRETNFMAGAVAAIGFLGVVAAL